MIKVSGRRDARMQHTWNKIIRSALHETLDIDPKKKSQKSEVTMGSIKYERERAPSDFYTLI